MAIRRQVYDTLKFELRAKDVEDDGIQKIETKIVAKNEDIGAKPWKEVRSESILQSNCIAISYLEVPHDELPPGEYKIIARATDDKGNIGKETIASFVVLPEVNFERIYNGNLFPIRYKLKNSEAITLIEWKVDDGEWKTVGASTSIISISFLEPGEHRMSVRAISERDNNIGKATNYIVKVGPKVAIEEPVYCRREVRINLRGGNAYRWRRKNGLWSNWNNSGELVISFPPGRHGIIFQARDVEGNVGQVLGEELIIKFDRASRSMGLFLGNVIPFQDIGSRFQDGMCYSVWGEHLLTSRFTIQGVLGMRKFESKEHDKYGNLVAIPINLRGAYSLLESDYWRTQLKFYGGVGIHAYQFEEPVAYTNRMTFALEMGFSIDLALFPLPGFSENIRLVWQNGLSKSFSSDIPATFVFLMWGLQYGF